MLECLLTPENTPPDCAKELYELYFVFAAVWAFGGCLFQDQILYMPLRGFPDHHDVSINLSSQIYVHNSKNTHFFVAVEELFYVTLSLERFVKTGRNLPETPEYFLIHMQACVVHTTETIRVRYFMEHLLESRHPLMLVGNAGSGKSVLVGDQLQSLETEKYVIKNVPFNYYTTSAVLQGTVLLESSFFTVPK